MQGCLVPGLQVLDLWFGEHFGSFFGRGPVQPTDQVLAVFLAGKSACPLLLCFLVKCVFDGCPVILQVDVGFGHESRFMAMPLVDGLGRPSPFFQVG